MDKGVPASPKHIKSTTENLLAQREGLIAEIQEHMMNRTLLPEQLEKEMNLTYDLFEGPFGMLKGSMNGSEDLEEADESLLSLQQVAGENQARQPS